MTRSHFIAAMVGGLAATGALVVFGVTRGPRTLTIVEEAPVAAQPAASSGVGLTAHAIYQRAAPAVVFVHARLVEPVQSPFAPDPVPGSDVSTGSGFLVDQHGDILTAYHIIDGADRSRGVAVTFEGDVTRPAAVVAVDPADDLAVLNVDMDGVPPVRPLPRGDSTSVRVGDPTLAIGNPFGLDRTLTSGIVSALQHEIVAADGRTINNVIQTDQPVDPGTAGGPLLNAGGEVVGIDSQIAAGGSAGGALVSFAIPIDTADLLLARVTHGGAVRLAYLGVSGTTADDEHAGAYVVSVVKDGPAALAGVKPGDAILRVDNLAVHSIGQVIAVVRARSPGQSLTLELRRGRRTRTVMVVLGSLTEPAGG